VEDGAEEEEDVSNRARIARTEKLSYKKFDSKKVANIFTENKLGGEGEEI
jgi:hypothetical protein